MSPSKLFAVIFSAILAAAAVIYGIREVSTRVENTKVKQSQLKTAMAAAGPRIHEIEELRDAIVSREDRDGALKLAYQYRAEIFAELAPVDHGSPEHVFWKAKLETVEQLIKEISERRVYR